MLHLDHSEGHLKTSSARLLRLYVAETKCSELSGTLVFRGNSTIVRGGVQLYRNKTDMDN